jgi:hypothetical protein
MPFEPHNPRELRAQVKYYFSNVQHFIAKQDAHNAAFNGSRLAHFGVRLLEHPTIQKEFEAARKLAEAQAKQKTAEEYEKAVAEADAAVVARLTAPVEG